ncbi:MAG: serine protease, partial [Candidatus Electrothrix sp. ATG2]|nr:serine protease [Candidatus Electrothrix sp. ATG2]
MPNRSDIQNEILKYKNAGQDVLRRRYQKNLHKYTKRDTIVYASAYASGKNGIPPFALSVSTEDIQGFMTAINGLKGDKLDLILHSPGGSLEAAEQIVNYLRAKYSHIRAIIPQNAMSAATMIACAADVIIMGKQSAIGPIDPQITIPTQHGPFTAPAQAILDEFDKAKEEVIAKPQVAPLWVSKMKNYPPGIFNICKDTVELAKEKVDQWIYQYMFKSDEKLKQKAKEIAGWLG